MKNEALRILIVEDEPIIARNLQQILQAKRYSIVGLAYDEVAALDHLAAGSTDLVLLDINLGGQFSGLDIAASLFNNHRIPFIFITSYADPDTLARAKVFQPAGYIVKPFEEKAIYSAIEIAWYNYQNQQKEFLCLEALNQKLLTPLTPKEYTVLLDLADGKLYREIANRHYVSINTINTHVKSIYGKLEVHSRTEAIKILRSK